MHSEYYLRRQGYLPTKTLILTVPGQFQNLEEGRDNTNHDVFQHLWQEQDLPAISLEDTAKGMGAKHTVAASDVV